jgi:hypothetical protein
VYLYAIEVIIMHKMMLVLGVSYLDGSYNNTKVGFRWSDSGMIKFKVWGMGNTEQGVITTFEMYKWDKSTTVSASYSL